jgi:hypothetical protein
MTQPGSNKLQRDDGSEDPNSWNDSQLRPFYMQVVFVVHFCLLPIALAHEANTSVRGAALCTHIRFI